VTAALALVGYTKLWTDRLWLFTHWSRTRRMAGIL